MSVVLSHQVCGSSHRKLRMERRKGRRGGGGYEGEKEQKSGGQVHLEYEDSEGMLQILLEATVFQAQQWN